MIPFHAGRRLSVVHVGQVLQTFVCPVERGKVREFAAAILEDNPVYYSDEAWTNPNHKVPMPLTFTQVSSFFAQSGAASQVLGLDYKRLLHGEQEFEYRKPVYAGQVLSGRQRVANIYQKPGKRGGMMEFYVIDTEYRDEAGDVAIVSRQVLIQLPKPS